MVLAKRMFVKGLDTDPLSVPTVTWNFFVFLQGLLPLPRLEIMLLSILISLCGAHIYPRNQAAAIFPGEEMPVSPGQSCEDCRIPNPGYRALLQWDGFRGRQTSTQQDFRQDRVQDNPLAFTSGIFQKRHAGMTSPGYFSFTGGQWKKKLEMLLGWARRICC